MVPTNIEWCEAVTHPYYFSENVVEYFNTWSNLGTVVIGFIGLNRALQLPKHNRNGFIFTEIMIIIVAFGSIWFHSQRTYLGEILDECPMSILAFGYLLCLDDLHWSTQLNWKPYTYFIMTCFVVIGWIYYFVWDLHEIFTHVFTIQIIVPSFISFLTAGVIGHSRSLWVYSTASIVLGRVVWEWERSLHRNGNCPVLFTDFEYWLHPIWHVLSGMSHYFWTKYVGSMAIHKSKRT